MPHWARAQRNDRRKKNTANKQTNARSFPLPRYINAKIIIFIRGWKYYSNSMWNFCLYTYLVNQPIRSVKHIHSHWQKIQSQQQHLKQHHASFYVNQLVAPAKNVDTRKILANSRLCLMLRVLCLLFALGCAQSKQVVVLSQSEHYLCSLCIFGSSLFVDRLRFFFTCCTVWWRTFKLFRTFATVHNRSRFFIAIDYSFGAICDWACMEISHSIIQNAVIRDLEPDSVHWFFFCIIFKCERKKNVNPNWEMWISFQNLLFNRKPIILIIRLTSIIKFELKYFVYNWNSVLNSWITYSLSRFERKLRGVTFTFKLWVMTFDMKQFKWFFGTLQILSCINCVIW